MIFIKARLQLLMSPPVLFHLLLLQLTSDGLQQNNATVSTSSRINIEMSHLDKGHISLGARTVAPFSDQLAHASYTLWST